MGLEDELCEFAIPINGISSPLVKPDFFICKYKGLYKCICPRNYDVCEHREKQKIIENYRK